MEMLKRMRLIVALFLALLVALAIGGAISAPASAAAPEAAVVAQAAVTPEMQACAPSGQRRVCVWFNDTWSGPPAYYWTIPTGSNPPGWCINFGSGVNDKVRSWLISPGPRSATLKQHANCSGIANSYIDQVNNESACWSSGWWPGCGASLNQGSSIWVLKV